MSADDRARVIALTEDERRDLGCACLRLDNEWHHVLFCRVPVVERILAQRAAADQAALLLEFARCLFDRQGITDIPERTVARFLHDRAALGDQP